MYVIDTTKVSLKIGFEKNIKENPQNAFILVYGQVFHTAEIRKFA